MSEVRQIVDRIWSVSDLLLADLPLPEWREVILPLTVLRSLEYVLKPTRSAVLAAAANLGRDPPWEVDLALRRAAQQPCYNISPSDLATVLTDPEHVARSLRAYVGAFSSGVVEVLDAYGFDAQITRLHETGMLLHVIDRFAHLDLGPDRVSAAAMGDVFDELLQQLVLVDPASTGAHSTPRDVSLLMADLQFAEDGDALAAPRLVKTLYDPACGNGGALSVAEAWLRRRNRSAELTLFGQEADPQAYAACRSAMMLKNHDISSMKPSHGSSHIARGDSCAHDAHDGAAFDYMLANRRSGWAGERSSRSSRVRPSVAVPADSKPGPRASTTVLCSTCSTCSPR